jgi:hypothetical protein
LAQKTLASLPKETSLTVVPAEGEEFLYQLIASSARLLLYKRHAGRPFTRPMAGAESEVGKLAAAPAAAPSKLIVNDRLDNSLRFRLYER